MPPSCPARFPPCISIPSTARSIAKNRTPPRGIAGMLPGPWSLVIVGVDADPKKAPALKKWARDYWEAIHPFDLDGAYPNFMMDDEGEARLEATYGGNYDRLAELK